MKLSRYGIRPDPMAPLREFQGGEAISPVFGGRSADAEFEVLCGLPASIDFGQVVFRDLAPGDIDCLPRKLARLGWATVATVPVSRNFFLAGDAYVRFGFQRQFFKPELDMTDLDGDCLSTDSLLAQVRKNTTAANNHRPIFTYTFTTFGHIPFARNERLRPDKIGSSSESAEINNFANVIYYNSSAVRSHIDDLLQDDPSSLIVVLGDHAPSLGPNRSGYSEGGLAGLNDADDLALHHVPLFMIDAGRPVILGRLPHYVLPEVIMDRLTGGRFCAVNRCHADERIIRPYPDRAVEISRFNSDSLSCQEGDTGPACAPVLNSAQRLRSATFHVLR